MALASFCLVCFSTIPLPCEANFESNCTMKRFTVISIQSRFDSSRFNTTHKNSRTLVNSRDHMIKWSFFGSQCVLYTGISSFKAFGLGYLLSIEQ